MVVVKSIPLLGLILVPYAVEISSKLDTEKRPIN